MKNHPAAHRRVWPRVLSPGWLSTRAHCRRGAAWLLAAGLIAQTVQPALAGGLERLDDFLRHVHAGRADFTQTVSAPARAGQPARSKKSAGRFEFQRPAQFRFSYTQPYAQTLVADGQTLWLHDPDLNQVTARRQAQALASTPAALIATAPDLRAIEADFVLQDQPEQDGLQWLLARARKPDSALQTLRLGWRDTPHGSELAQLEMQDGLGQTSVLRFTRFEINPVLEPQLFRFKPPPGADLIRP